MILYEPREDSFLMQKAVKKYAKGRVLDVGTGSGIQAATAKQLKRVKSVTAVDIQKEVITYCKKKYKGIKFLTSDLFSNAKGKFDTIIFNPPYLPDDKGPKNVTVIGGKKGYETLVRFINEAGDYLMPNGCMLILFSSLTGKDMVDQKILQNLIDKKQIAAQNIPFETLYVYLLTKNKLRRELEKTIKELRYFSRGWRGMIHTGTYRGKRIAVKTKRPGMAADIHDEAKWLVFANVKGIGPKLVLAGKNFLAYEFAEGVPIGKWQEKATKQQVKRVLKQVLKQCFTLDQLGITKGEMTNPYKHIIIGKKTVMLDFERCHRSNKPHNVTQFIQYIRKANRQKKLGMNDHRLLQGAMEYRKRPMLRTFNRLLALLR